MTLPWAPGAAVAVATLLSIAALVFAHFEGLAALGRRYGEASPGAGDERRIMKVVFGLLTLHALEIALLGLVYWGLLMIPGTGTIVGTASMSFADSIYFSSVTYTTVGFGELSPDGPIRLLAGAEALTGFVLLTWSASFTYRQMSRQSSNLG